jgi:putative sigma-54 modulation protein
MKVNINAVHFKADTNLEAFIQQKLKKLSNFYDGIFGSDVHLKLANNGIHENKIVEIRILIKGYDLFASKQSKSFEEATDIAIEALKKQLKKHKEKQRKK